MPTIASALVILGLMGFIFEYGRCRAPGNLGNCAEWESVFRTPVEHELLHRFYGSIRGLEKLRAQPKCTEVVRFLEEQSFALFKP